MSTWKDTDCVIKGFYCTTIGVKQNETEEYYGYFDTSDLDYQENSQVEIHFNW